MTDWTDGYLSDVAYTKEFYRQTTPAWLSMAILLNGHRPPRIDRRFRWCDLGCGQGFTALSVAACHPEAEVFAFDFNPAHIDNARTLASRGGIGNVAFSETSFEELARAPREALPPMDFIVLHGIWSWVSSTQRAHLLRFIADRLAPGGVVYLSYNALAGWAAMLPVQRLMRLLSETRPGSGDEVVQSVLGFVQELANSDAEYFRNNPVVAKRLDHVGKQNSHYLAHEFLHATWDPLPFDAVARDLAEAKCDFIGSATLLNNIDAYCVPPQIAAMLAKTSDVHVREALRDFGAAQTFRRDLYRRGNDKPVPGELAALLDEIVLTDLGLKREAAINITTGASSSMALKMDVYGPVLERLSAGPLAVAELRRSLSDPSAAREILSVLCASSYAHPTPSPQPSTVQIARTQGLNRAISLHNRQGGALNFQVSPNLGTALPVEAFETMIMEEFAAGVPGDLAPMIDRLAAILMERGLLPMQDGALVNAAETLAALRQSFDNFIAARVPLFQRAGILGK
jgi:SAM-dependent methyltransferase